VSGVDTPSVRIRRLVEGDLAECVALNNAAVPAVSQADAGLLARLVAMSSLSLVADAGGEVAGFCINLGPGADYGSVNYAWFSTRYDEFVYLDRVVVAPEHRNRGIGSQLYAAVEAATDEPWFLAEVNVRPRNDGSLRFHARHGFVEVGQQDTPYGARVAMLAKDLSAVRAAP
jgi:predicted GNAT superfamily acetyltransferase